ncbi:MAG TPA: NAD-dependent epimerase/dehydratase family protein, partial [Thermoanaerobaculia bacterium]|nr:NAD-dependent epimerase/dehydratase family protein [Thermoanaerobaculia bacterium]
MEPRIGRRTDARAVPGAGLRALVTGANGFIGRFVCERLQQAGHIVRASVRTASAGGFPHDE